MRLARCYLINIQTDRETYNAHLDDLTDPNLYRDPVTANIWLRDDLLGENVLLLAERVSGERAAGAGAAIILPNMLWIDL